MENILPLEDAEAHERARPIEQDGKVVIEKAASQERHDAMVRNVLAGEQTVVVVVLGGAHDLSESVKRLAADAECLRVTLKAYPE